jgi:hypothetical protein
MPSVNVGRPIFRCRKRSSTGWPLDLIRTGKSAGRETWNIWYLFAFRPEMT